MPESYEPPVQNEPSIGDEVFSDYIDGLLLDDIALIKSAGQDFTHLDAPIGLKASVVLRTFEYEREYRRNSFELMPNYWAVKRTQMAASAIRAYVYSCPEISSNMADLIEMTVSVIKQPADGRSNRKWLKAVLNPTNKFLEREAKIDKVDKRYYKELGRDALKTFGIGLSVQAIRTRIMLRNPKST